MKNKFGIIALTVLVTLFCAYFLYFTKVSRGIENEAVEYATNAEGEYDLAKKQGYVDSLWNIPVFNFLGLEYTLKEVKENELNLGLDLQGGMHVVLEVSPNEIIKAMAGRNVDAKLIQALRDARTLQKTRQEQFSDLFYESFKEKNPDIELKTIFSNQTNKNRINSTSTDEEVMKVLNEEIDVAIERSLTILKTRIDKFGVSQPQIQQLKGSNRIQVELPGVDNPNRVRKLLQGVAKLELMEVYENEKILPALNDLNTYLYEKEGGADDENVSADSTSGVEGEGQDELLTEETQEDLLTDAADSTSSDEAVIDPADTTNLAEADSTAADSSANKSKASKLFTMFQYDQQSGNGFYCKVLDTGKVNAYMLRTDVNSFLPRDARLVWNYQPVFTDDNGIEWTKAYFVQEKRKRNSIEGDVIIRAGWGIEQNGRGYEVTMSMNPEGAKKWKKLTEKLSVETIEADNSGNNSRIRLVAAVLDGLVYSAPRIGVIIPNGSSSITGNFTKEEAGDLANILKAGSLPAPLRIVEETVVGPSIGQEAIDKGLLSILAGLCLVIVFMVMYYNKGGFVADLALLINIFFIVGILAQIGTSLTLPGIAGIVLTIGMSIDANVLIFERIKEEMAMGRKRLAAISMGYKKAFSAIIDSNITTFLTGLILFLLGSGPVKGFAATLMVGIICSFFSAVFISRLVIEFMTKKNEGENLKFDTFISRGLLQNLNFDFVGKRKMAYTFSIGLILVGFTTVFMQGGWNLGVDFKGGRSFVVDFDQPMIASDVVEPLRGEDAFGNSSIEVKTFGKDNRLKITTSFLVDEESAEADSLVEVALMSGLQSFNSKKSDIQSSSKVGATIADDIQNTAKSSVVLALLAIFLYILMRFRKWQFGLGAIIALMHDVMMVLGIISIVRLLGVPYEIDQVFIAAMLTIIGYSINDTVVVFDRVREYLVERPSADVKDTFNKSINSTLNRTLMTSVTTLLVVVVLFLFGGEVLKGFSFSLLIGIFFGTYSSIFIATPVVLDTAMRKLKKAKATE